MGGRESPWHGDRLAGKTTVCRLHHVPHPKTSNSLYTVARYEVRRLLYVSMSTYNESSSAPFFLKVQWKDWQRNDGSSTTWEYLADEASDSVRDVWENKMRKKNSEAAKGNNEVDIRNISNYLPHNIHTAEIYEAYEEKLALSRDKKTARSWDAEISKLRNGHNRPKVAKREVSQISNCFTKGKKRKRTGSMSSNGSLANSSTIGGSSTERIKGDPSTLFAVQLYLQLTIGYVHDSFNRKTMTMTWPPQHPVIPDCEQRSPTTSERKPACHRMIAKRCKLLGPKSLLPLAQNASRL